MTTRSKNIPDEDFCSPTALVPYLPSKCEARVYCKRGTSSIFRRWKRKIVKVKANVLLIYKCARDQVNVSPEHDESYEEAISLHGFVVRQEVGMAAKSTHKLVLSLCHPTSPKKRLFFSSSPATLDILAGHMNAACATVSLSDFKQIRQIGQGAYGEVMLVQHVATGELLAMKTMSKQSSIVNGVRRSPALMKHVIQERAALEQGRESPYISQLRYAFQDKEKWYLVMEYIQGGELFAFRQRQPHQRFPASVVCVWAAQLVSAIQLLHRKNVVHRDVKLENLLLDPQFNIRLTDFGLCKNLEVWSVLHQTTEGDSPGLLAVNSPSDVFSVLSSSSDLLVPEQSTTASTVVGDIQELKEERRMSPFPRSCSFCGTSDYISPEMIISALRPGQRYGYEVDWWALGIVLYEVLVGVAPFRATDTMQLYTKILQDPLEWPPGLNLPAECKDFVEQLLNKHPTRRLGKTIRGFEGEDDKIIRGHPFFKSIDWAALDVGSCPPLHFASDLGLASPTKAAPRTPVLSAELPPAVEDYSEWEVRLDGYSYVAVSPKSVPHSTVIGMLTKRSFPSSTNKPTGSENSVSNLEFEFHDYERHERSSFHSQSGLVSRQNSRLCELKVTENGQLEQSPCLSAYEPHSLYSSPKSRPGCDPDVGARRKSFAESVSDIAFPCCRDSNASSCPPTPSVETLTLASQTAFPALDAKPSPETPTVVLRIDKPEKHATPR